MEWLGTQINADGVKCEGYGGWKAANFLLTERIGENTNPFYNPDPEIKRFDFAFDGNDAGRIDRQVARQHGLGRQLGNAAVLPNHLIHEFLVRG